MSNQLCHLLFIPKFRVNAKLVHLVNENDEIVAGTVYILFSVAAPPAASQS